jgi:hypothetical protein
MVLLTARPPIRSVGPGTRVKVRQSNTAAARTMDHGRVHRTRWEHQLCDRKSSSTFCVCWGSSKTEACPPVMSARRAPGIPAASSAWCSEATNRSALGATISVGVRTVPRSARTSMPRVNAICAPVSDEESPANCVMICWTTSVGAAARYRSENDRRPAACPDPRRLWPASRPRAPD